MALTRGGDYPIHQTAEPVACTGTDRNFYDRYFFNGSAAEGDGDALRQALIALHEAVEDARDLPRHRAIVALYSKMARARRLDLPAR